MGINYIIATYAGINNPNRNKHHVLRRQLQCLHNVMVQQGSDTLIKQITVVCPEAEEKEVYRDYYNIPKEWNLPIKFVRFYGDNRHKQYEQWIHGFVQYSYYDYNILITDDYCVDESNLTFDRQLVKMYQEQFPDNTGVLVMDDKRCLIGLASSETLNKIDVYDFYESDKYGQQRFRDILANREIKMKNFNSQRVRIIIRDQDQIIELSKPGIDTTIFYPVQCTGLDTGVYGPTHV